MKNSIRERNFSSKRTCSGRGSNVRSIQWHQKHTSKSRETIPLILGGLKIPTICSIWSNYMTSQLYWKRGQILWGWLLCRFKNLKNDEFQNWVTQNESASIWVPTIKFDNTDSKWTTVNDEKVACSYINLLFEIIFAGTTSTRTAWFIPVYVYLYLIKAW
jgi:hypothetical protein